MKAIILAAGLGTRMKGLTKETPKSLLKVNGKPIIDYIFDALPEEIDEVIVVVKRFGDKIKKHLENRDGVEIIFAEGSDEGNSYSFLGARDYLKDERFLLIYGDEIPSRLNIENCLKEDLSILTFDGGTYDGVMVLNTDMFDYEPTDDQFRTSLGCFVREHNVRLVQAVDFIGGINSEDDIVRVEKELKKLNG